MTETENLTLEILKKIQNNIDDLDHRVEDGFSNMNLQFAALNEKLSGQLISEIEFREELHQLQTRIQRIERRLELSDK